MEERKKMNVRMFSALVGLLIVAGSAQGQLNHIWWSQYVEAGASANGSDGGGAWDSDTDYNADFGPSYVDAGAFAQYGGNTGSGIARQTTFVDGYRMEAIHYGDGAANATGFEGDTAGGGALCQFMRQFSVPEATPFVAWGNISAQDSSYAYFKLAEGDSGGPAIISEDRGRFLYTGELSANFEYALEYRSNAGAGAWWERTFRSGLFGGEVFFKINTILSDELMVRQGRLQFGSISSLDAMGDGDVLQALPMLNPWNRTNFYTLTPMPPKPGKKLTGDVVCQTSSATPTLWIRAFNWRIQQWVYGYQGPTSTTMKRYFVEFPGFQTDYISPASTLYRGKVLASVAWMGRANTPDNWMASVDMYQLSWR